MQGHGATHGATATNVRALRLSAGLILVYFVAEVAIALVTGSLALLADAGHELSTAAAIGVSLVAIRLAGREPSRTRTFGLLRVEILAALANGLLLVAMAVLIIVRGYQRLLAPVAVPSTPMYVMALGGIGLEIASLVIMYRGQKESLNIRGSFWHVMNAFLGSIAVIIAATFISVGRIYVADAWAGVIFAFVLLYAAFGIIRDAVNVLTDQTPKDVDLAAVERDLLGVPGVRAVHHLHARTLTGHITTFSGHLVVEDLRESGRILRAAKGLLDERYKFALSTVQLEDDEFAETDLPRLDYVGDRADSAT